MKMSVCVCYCPSLFGHIKRADVFPVSKNTIVANHYTFCAASTEGYFFHPTQSNSALLAAASALLYVLCGLYTFI